MQKPFTHIFYINGMNCSDSVTTVRDALSALPGVASAKVDLRKRQAAITSSEIIKKELLRDVLGNMNYTIYGFAVNA